MPNSKILVAQLGARRHYQEPLLFHHWGILDRLYTDFYSGDSNIIKLLRYPYIYGKLPIFIKQILDRYEPDLDKVNIIHFPKFAYEYKQALRKASFEEKAQIFCWAGQQFCQKIIQSGLGEANTIYGFNSACLELFQYAQNKGIRCILDQTLADYSLTNKLLLEEEKYWKGWSLTPFRISNFDLKLMRRERHEQDLADHIICGSSFVKDSLVARGVDSHKIAVRPLGSLKNNQSIQIQSEGEIPQIREEGLRILFVGSVGLRKGIPYLLEALRQVKGQIPFICKIVGSSEINPERLTEYNDVCNFMGQVSRSQIRDLYSWADVFVLPSICEGSAMVIYEALSLGVPVITTYNSGSVVRDGIDGYIIPIRNINAIAEKLIKIYENPNYFVNTNIQSHLNQIIQESKYKFKQLISI